MSAQSNLPSIRPERWLPVPHWPNYLVSNFGRVWSIGAKRPLRLRLSGCDYFHVQLWRNGQARDFFIHDLVAGVFLGPKPERMTVDHKDGNHQDNALENLKYETSAGNTQRAISLGLRPRGVKAKLRRDEVISIRQLFEQGIPALEIASRYGTSAWNVRAIARRRTWKI